MTRKEAELCRSGSIGPAEAHERMFGLTASVEATSAAARTNTSATMAKTHSNNVLLRLCRIRGRDSRRSSPRLSQRAASRR